MDEKQLKNLLKKVKAEELSIDEAVGELRRLPFEDIGFARIDHHRPIRCGFPEVIFCPGKTTEQIVKIFEKLAATGHNVLATRAEQNVYDAITASEQFPQAQYDSSARTIILKQEQTEQRPGYIAIVTAGTADIPVAQEAKVTAEITGCRTETLFDVGVAGLHRLLGNISLLQKADVVIVVAGMEGALASVVGGLVDCPVIAVPTSIGYGASYKGIAALLAMLNSCAAGVTVVNIDNGFSAGLTASLINRRRTTTGNEK